MTDLPRLAGPAELGKIIDHVVIAGGLHYAHVIRDNGETHTAVWSGDRLVEIAYAPPSLRDFAIALRMLADLIAPRDVAAEAAAKARELGVDVSRA